MSYSEYEWIDEAIRSALDRGCVPFIAVVPVTRELLRDAAAPIDKLIGDTASKDVARAVRDWQEADRTTGTEPA